MENFCHVGPVRERIVQGIGESWRSFAASSRHGLFACKEEICRGCQESAWRYTKGRTMCHSCSLVRTSKRQKYIQDKAYREIAHDPSRAYRHTLGSELQKQMRRISRPLKRLRLRKI